MCSKAIYIISILFFHFCGFYSIFFLFTEITCTKSSLNLTPYATVTNDKQSYIFDEEVAMSCNYGFSGKIVTARCTDADIWSKNSPTCRRTNFILAIYKSVIVESRPSTVPRHSMKNNLKIKELDFHTV